MEPQAVLLARLQSSAGGLSEAQAAEILKRVGPNVISSHRGSLLAQVWARLRNPLVLLLIVASAVSAMTGDATSFMVIIVVVLMSVTLDFVQETRAANAAERLRRSVALRSTVLRGGTKSEVPAAELVPGDVVLLTAGDLVPADGVLLEARDCFVNQAVLTGEPYPVEKNAGEVTATTGDLGAAANAMFMGTSIISGSAHLLIVRTGAGTALGNIGDTLSRRAPPSALEIGSHRFGLLIMRLTVFLVLFVLLANALLHRPWLESFMFAVALAVGLTPELLPMIVSVTLARGALRMAQKKVIVKRLGAIHDLGQMDVLCTDKTGTLTEARIRLERHVDSFGRDSEQVLKLAYLNSFFETGLRSPLDDAILQHGEIDVAAWRKIDEVPFDFERRRVSVLVEDDTRRLLVVKGAPESIVKLCKFVDSGADASSPCALNQTDRQRIDALFEALSQEGFRVLAIASRKAAFDHPHAVVGDETELTFAGFAAFLDPPKLQAKESLASLINSGVAVKIVTGDNELVTRHICGALDLPIAGVLLGDQIGAMDDQALAVQAEAVTLFCRVTPAQKNRIVSVLKRRGHVVGYLGDGINDAPALHVADAGISVDEAVDVAKEAADLILLEHDLRVLHEGVLEGRRTFGNIQKYLMMATSSNFGNMFSMAGATLFLPFLPMTSVQILLNNLLYDVSEIAIPFDDVDPEETKQPRTWDIHFIRNFMLALGPVSSVFDFLTFYVMLAVLHADEALFRTGWFIESMATQVLVIFVIRTRGKAWRSRTDPRLTVSSLGVVAISVALPFTSIGYYFGFVVPPLNYFLILGVMVVAYLVLVEVVKRWFYGRYRR
jgi:Mg2+-importing ATPase